MTVNSELKIGALEETLTVTGASPTVDVQTSTKSQVLNREALDAIPTGRTIQGMLLQARSWSEPASAGSSSSGGASMDPSSELETICDGSSATPALLELTRFW